MIISGGENVYPSEVENLLGTHPASASLPPSSSTAQAARFSLWLSIPITKGGHLRNRVAKGFS
jgi:acyl-CoA synthetase (AMP-forming)/AMP-acid ligase II